MPTGESKRDWEVEALVVGAGPAGLATAAMLSRAGIEVRVLEKGEAVGSSWRQRYDGLRLNTIRWLSALPGLRLSRRQGRWISREAYAAYLERYASSRRLAVELGVEATRVDRDAGAWVVQTSGGTVHARHVVVATGYYHSPRALPWPNAGAFPGRVLHAAAYRAASEFAGQDVLVVGAGNTGTEIAQQLAEGGAARVRLSIRTPPNIVPRELLGLPTHPLSLLARGSPPWMLDRSTRVVTRLTYGDLEPYGLPFPPKGVHTTSLQMRPPVIDAGFVRLVKRGAIETVPSVSAISATGVELADGTAIEPEAVIAAVGYEPALDPLLGHLDVLDDSGRPAYAAPETHPGAPDLYCVGFRPKLGGFLVDFRFEAQRTARAVAARAQH
jgi:putative flavoprotein involved in K+ transport